MKNEMTTKQSRAVDFATSEGFELFEMEKGVAVMALTQHPLAVKWIGIDRKGNRKEIGE